MLAFPPPAANRAVQISRGKIPLLPITPATYLTLRREAAGLTRMQVARRLYEIKIRRFFGDRRPRRLFDSVARALATIEQLEVPGARARYRPVIDVLGGIFPLDADVYHQLIDEPADRHPAICRGCGCSAHDACDGTCTLAGDVCTHCVFIADEVMAHRIWRSAVLESRAA
jgi:hypothetical protein